MCKALASINAKLVIQAAKHALRICWSKLSLSLDERLEVPDSGMRNDVKSGKAQSWPQRIIKHECKLRPKHSMRHLRQEI